MIAQVPELADGGYWYVVAVVPNEDLVLAPDLPPGTPWAQWFNDGVRCVVRTVDPVTVPDMGITPSSLINFHRKPKARIGGR